MRGEEGVEVPGAATNDRKDIEQVVEKKIEEHTA